MTETPFGDLQGSQAAIRNRNPSIPRQIYLSLVCLHRLLEIIDKKILIHIVQWGSPTGTKSDLASSNFAEASTSFDLVTAMGNKDGDDYKAILSDMEAISNQIKQLQTNNVPILFRPLVSLTFYTEQ